MTFSVIAAAVSVLMVVMVTVGSCGDEFSLQVRFHSLISIALSACHQLDSRIRERLLSASADTAADQPRERRVRHR